MAILSDPHWEGITPGMRRMLVHLGQQPFTRRFYLAGETALSLQPGHRHSVDFDFFSEIDELDERSRDEILLGLSTLPVQVIENVGGNLLLTGQEKYRLFRDFPLMVLESMRLFDNADRDVQPELFDKIPWEQVKQFFIEQARLLSTHWFA